MNNIGQQIEATCNGCGQKYADSGELKRGSLDAYADLSVDYDLFCAVCDSEDITLHQPDDNKGNGVK